MAVGGSLEERERGVETLSVREKPLLLSLPESGSGDCKYKMRTKQETVDSFSRKKDFSNGSCDHAKTDCSSWSKAVGYVTAFFCFLILRLLLFFGTGFLSASFPEVPMISWSSCKLSPSQLDISTIRDWTA